MKISFVIPAFNEELRIAQCVQSVLNELSAGVYEAEIIVVNNASTDGTRAIALSMTGVQVIDKSRKGLVRARSAGFLASDGDLIANIDADTLLPAGWVKTVFREFDRDKDLVALSGPFVYFDLGILPKLLVRAFYLVGYFANFMLQHVFKIGAMIQGGNFIVRRSALNKIGGYDTNIEFYGEDTDIARRLSRVGLVKWTLDLPILASGRRLKEEGLVRVGARYAVNFFWVNLFGRPWTKTYTDIRTK